MKKVIGYIHSDKKLTKDDQLFLKIAKKRGIELEIFNLLDEINEEELEKRIKRCNIFYNNSSEEFAIEFVKTIESLGKKVIDSSETYFNIEDKWVFYLKCKKNKIPVPKTILLSENTGLIKKELSRFGSWPVVLKRISGTTGDYVEKADNINEAIKVINKFWKKGGVAPIICQEMIRSDCYRVTVIGNEIVQTAVKQTTGWKATGVYAKKIKRFSVDKKLAQIIKRLVKISKIKVMGVDLLKKDGEWSVLEVNSNPAFDFFEEERETLISKVFDLLEKE